MPTADRGGTKFSIHNIPNSEVESYCKSQKSSGAIDVEITDNGDGTSTVVVTFPDNGDS